MTVLAIWIAYLGYALLYSGVSGYRDPAKHWSLFQSLGLADKTPCNSQQTESTPTPSGSGIPVGVGPAPLPPANLRPITDSRIYVARQQPQPRPSYVPLAPRFVPAHEPGSKPQGVLDRITEILKRFPLPRMNLPGLR